MTANGLADPAIIAPNELKFEITGKIVCPSCYFVKRK